MQEIGFSPMAPRRASSFPSRDSPSLCRYVWRGQPSAGRARLSRLRALPIRRRRVVVPRRQRIRITGAIDDPAPRPCRRTAAQDLLQAAQGPPQIRTDRFRFTHGALYDPEYIVASTTLALAPGGGRPAAFANPLAGPGAFKMVPAFQAAANHALLIDQGFGLFEGRLFHAGYLVMDLTISRG